MYRMSRGPINDKIKMRHNPRDSFVALRGTLVEIWQKKKTLTLSGKKLRLKTYIDVKKMQIFKEIIFCVCARSRHKILMCKM